MLAAALKARSAFRGSQGSPVSVVNTKSVFAQIDPAQYQQSPIHVRQPNVRSRGELGPYRFGRTSELLDRPGRYLVWLPADEARSLFRDRQPLLTVTLPDGKPSQQVYETERR